MTITPHPSRDYVDLNHPEDHHGLSSSMEDDKDVGADLIAEIPTKDDNDDEQITEMIPDSPDSPDTDHITETVSVVCLCCPGTQFHADGPLPPPLPSNYL